jgi:aminopeptidase
MFDDRVYKRGALALHAVRLTVGDDAFFAVLRAWTRRHAHGSVSTEQFVETASHVSEVNLDALLVRWLFTRALPPLPPAPD